MEATLTDIPAGPVSASNEFQQIAGDLQTAALAELLGVSKQMICRYRLHGAPADKMERLRDHIRAKADALVLPIS